MRHSHLLLSLSSLVISSHLLSLQVCVMIEILSVESSNLQQVKRLFDSFTTLLQSYPLLVQQARFAFISGCETLVPTRLVPYPAVYIEMKSDD